MPDLTGETLLYPILGDPIAQVMAPRHLTAVLEGRGLNQVVVPYHVPVEAFEPVMQSLRSVRNIHGIVITIPHKVAALAACDEVSTRAAFVGSVNVIRKSPDGRLLGDNVDGLGYLDGIEARGLDIMEKRTLLIGAGGAGSAVALEILERGASYLAIHDIAEARCDRLIGLLDERFPGRVGRGSRNPLGYDLIANVSPCGMRDQDPYPVDIERLAPEQFVAEAITVPEVTPLLAHAERLGCKTMTGAGMFHGEVDVLADILTG